MPQMYYNQEGELVENLSGPESLVLSFRIEKHFDIKYLQNTTTREDLNVIVENHGGLSSNGAWLAGVMKAVDLNNCGTLPDFGNFRVGKGEMYDRYKGVTELMPFAKAVSAKSHDFDEAGNEIDIYGPASDGKSLEEMVLAQMDKFSTGCVTRKLDK